MGTIITLTTDFGTSDGYVAAMKGLILSINPEAKLVDICHTIKPQNITQASFVLSTVYHYFPKRTIHLVAVDPGVGSKRRSIVVRTPLADFVAPDNGVLTYAINEFLESRGTENQSTLNQEIEAFSLTRAEFWHHPVSPTFHGRDIYAPVAARLSLGMPPEDLGERITSLAIIPVLQPQKTANEALNGHIIHVDNFGNLITDIREVDLHKDRKSLTILVAGKRICGLSRTYEEQDQLLALIGSSGYMEISLRNGSAGDFLGVGTGDKVIITQSTGDGR
jgi:S-adenosylmethionine hydrolase